MLKPAILYKDEIIKNYNKLYYTDIMMYESGSLDNQTPDIRENTGMDAFDYAIVNSEDKLIGYISFKIDWYSSGAYNFGLISFDPGNIIIGKDLYNLMNQLLNEYKLHRIEWRMVSGNPVERTYDRFLKKHNGNKYIMHDVFKDRTGQYHDSIVYEIISNQKQLVYRVLMGGGMEPCGGRVRISCCPRGLRYTGSTAKEKKMIVRLKKSIMTIEHYGKQKWDISKYDFICDDKEFEKLKNRESDYTIELRFAEPDKLPKGWINQGEKQGYNPYIYIIRKDMIQDKYFNEV